LTSIASLLRGVFESTIVIETRVDTNIPSINADPSALDGAIINLALNSRDAMPTGGRLVISARNVTLDENDIRIASKGRHGDFLCISVADNGMGMTPEVLEKARRPFFTTKPLGKGTGLGLSSVVGLAESVQGFVDIESTEGRGTTVSLHLPIFQDNHELTNFELAVVQEPTSSLRGKSILVIDDNENVRQVTTEFIQLLGHRTQAVGTGVEGIKLLQQSSQIDLIISDIVMPGGMMGYDVARWVTENKPTVKIILMTGNEKFSGLQGNTEATPAVPILQKPFTIHDLADQIGQAIGC
jgi:two-component system, chemotaxis family, CheB/CheR fusion protein